MNPELLRRLSDSEDQFTERKPEGAGSNAFKKALVAFANSVPPNRTGILFVGVADDGIVKGVSDPDKLQRTIRLLAETECYPPIYIDLALLDTSGGIVVAAIVAHSVKRPHFAGPAYVRRGSESIAATEEIYLDLLLSQDDKRRFLLEARTTIWTVELLNKEPGASQQLFDKKARSTLECKIEEVTAFFVRFRVIDADRVFTEMLQDVHISFDDKKNRPRAVIWPTGR
jgi:hypothetical protein